MNQFIDGKDIYLRPIKVEDKDFIETMFNDSLIRSKIGEIYPISIIDIKDLDKEQDSIWLSIVKKNENKLIGVIKLFHMNNNWKSADLSIIIYNKEDQGKGYGTEAVNLFLDYAFGSLNINRISIRVVGFNVLAITFFTKLGFIKEGIQEQAYYYNYEYYDFIMMRMLKEEFMYLKNN